MSAGRGWGAESFVWICVCTRGVSSPTATATGIATATGTATGTDTGTEIATTNNTTTLDDDDDDDCSYFDYGARALHDVDQV